MCSTRVGFVECGSGHLPPLLTCRTQVSWTPQPLFSPHDSFPPHEQQPKLHRSAGRSHLAVSTCPGPARVSSCAALVVVVAGVGHCETPGGRGSQSFLHWKPMRTRGPARPAARQGGMCQRPAMPSYSQNLPGQVSLTACAKAAQFVISSIVGLRLAFSSLSTRSPRQSAFFPDWRRLCVPSGHLVSMKEPGGASEALRTPGLQTNPNKCHNNAWLCICGMKLLVKRQGRAGTKPQSKCVIRA